MTIWRLFAVITLCTMGEALPARADELEPPVFAMGGVSFDTGDGSAYGRIGFRPSKELWFDARLNYVLDAERTGHPETTQLWFEAGAFLATNKPNRYSPWPMRRGWRAGGIVNRDVPEVGDKLETGFSDSTVLALYGGYGLRFGTPALRFTAGVDLLFAPVVTEGERRNSLGEPTVHDDDTTSRFGGRFDMAVQLGKPNYGLAIDTQMGYRPGIETQFYILIALGIYVAL